MDFLQEDKITNLSIELDSDAKENLQNASYWGKFIATFIFTISAFVLILFSIASAAFTSGFKTTLSRRFGEYGDFSSGIFIVIVIIALAFLCVVYYFLYNFSTNVKKALVSENSETLNKGLNSLKIYFIIMGVLGALGILSSLVSFF